MAEEGRKGVNLIARIGAAVVLDEVVIDGSPMECPVRRHEHACIGARTADDFAHVWIFHIILTRSLLYLLPYAEEPNQHQKRPIHDDRPRSHIAVCFQCFRILYACCFLSQPAQCPGPVQ